MNKIVLLGKLIKDPELKTIENGFLLDFIKKNLRKTLLL